MGIGNADQATIQSGRPEDLSSIAQVERGLNYRLCRESAVRHEAQ